VKRGKRKGTRRKREITTLQNTSRKYCARKGHALWRLLGYVPNPVALPILLCLLSPQPFTPTSKMERKDDIHL
jgi:hypothetical protein